MQARLARALRLLSLPLEQPSSERDRRARLMGTRGVIFNCRQPGGPAERVPGWVFAANKYNSPLCLGPEASFMLTPERSETKTVRGRGVMP